MILEMITKIKHIITGWFNYLTGKHYFMMKDRLRVCNKCIQKDGKFCSVCGCHLKAKASEPDENCPLDKW